MAHHLQGIGLSETPRTDWPALQKLKNAFLDGIPKGQIKDFQDSGIETFAGAPAAQCSPQRRLKLIILIF